MATDDTENDPNVTRECLDTDPHTLARWRLVLGQTAEEHGINCGGDGEAERIEQLVGFLFEPG